MAKASTKSVLDSIKALKGTKAPTVQKVEKVEKKQPTRQARPGKQNAGGTGGARPGAGRKTGPQDERRTTIKKSWEDFAGEEVEVTELHAGTKEQRKVKAKRLRVVQQKLYEQAVKGDVSAIKEFNDRVGGKARQPVVGDMEEDPVQVDLGVDRLLEKAYGIEPEEAE